MLSAVTLITFLFVSNAYETMRRFADVPAVATAETGIPSRLAMLISFTIPAPPPLLAESVNVYVFDFNPPTKTDVVHVDHTPVEIV